MNYRLLLYFILFEAVTFTTYWFIAGLIPLAFSQFQIFLGLITIDVIATKIAFPGAFKLLIDSIMNKE